MEQLSFTVDAGIINRLGLELVAKSETAVAELIKNAYDADANKVKVYFEQANILGGKLTIDDDGLGMTKKQLIDGFMRLATTDKIHNSISSKYGRSKAGKKGIGRFSTQRLGTKLIVLTQTNDSAVCYKLTINWQAYETDKEISAIKNILEEIPRESSKICGTKLIIENLRDKWSQADIKRVYRYVSGLIQPNYLKVDSNEEIIEENKKELFEALFFSRMNTDDSWTPIATPETMIFNRAIAIFNGFIDRKGYGHVHIETRNFTKKGNKEKYKDNITISKHSTKEVPFENLIGSKIAFRVYYFIGGSRNEYYGINQMEFKGILSHLEQNGGLKLYRNGFRVAKYGDYGDDWLGIDQKKRIGQGIPFGNNRILGFVQVTDYKGLVFEESAGREGLIEKTAFREMQAFISSAIETGFKRFASWFRKTDEYKAANPDKTTPATSTSTKKLADDLKKAGVVLSNPDSREEEKVKAAIVIKQVSNQLISQTRAVVNELEMLRVLAGLGIVIAEFIHEVKQFTPSLHGYISSILESTNLSSEIREDLLRMQDVVKSFRSYTSYFDSTISQNSIRELKSIDIRDAVRHFLNFVKMDTKKRRIQIDKKFTSHGLLTIEMHPSEWNTILQNLYSNAKKAIIRANRQKGKILIQGSKDRENVIVNFYDNGTGILKKDKDKIFNAFFTTSTTPSKYNEYSDEAGTGLGLYIIQQIIRNRGGEIAVEAPISDYNTCISVKIPIKKKSTTNGN